MSGMSAVPPRKFGSTKPRRDAGMSLAEVMVAMSIMTLVTVILGSTAVVAIRAAGGVTTRLDNATQAELGVSAASKLLRTAVLPVQIEDRVCDDCQDDTAVVRATSSEVSFYGNLGRTTVGPSLVTLIVLQDPKVPGTGILQERIIDPESLGDGRYRFCTPGAPGCAVRTRTLARSLTWPTTPVFGYYDTSGLPLTGSTMSASQLERISSVDLMLTAQTRPEQSRWGPLTVVQRVRLPNVEINLQTEDDT